MSHHFTESIGNLGLNSLEKSIFTIRPDTYHHALALHSVQQKIEIFRSSLKVRIHISDKLRTGIVETGLDCSAQARILDETDIIEVFISCTYFLDTGKAAVSRTIIDKENAGTAFALWQEFRKCLFQRIYIILFVIDGDHNRESVFSGLVHIRYHFYV